MSELIEFKNVKKTYSIGEKKFNALDGVSFTIGKGEFVVVLGPSGAGKSTLLNLLRRNGYGYVWRNYSWRRKHIKLQ